MRQILLLISLFWLTLTASAQLGSDTIHISPDLDLVKLTPNCYAQVSFSTVNGYGRVGANGLLLISGKKALSINTPWTNEETKQLYLYLSKNQIILDHVVVTHWHGDCLGGLGYLQQQFVLSTSCERTYEEARKRSLPTPFIRFKDTLTFNFEGQPIQCYYPGAAHTSDNIVVYLPNEKVLYGGCMIKDISATTLGNTQDANVAAWPASVANVRKKFPNASIVMPGHGQWGGYDLFDHTLHLLKK